MSEHDHPTFYISCCKPFVRWGPSGSPIKFHRFNCPVSPNKQIKGPIAGRAEVSSHAARLDPDAEDYEMYWRDRDDDEWTG